MMKLIIWGILSGTFYYAGSDGQVLCSQTFCKSYLSKNKCNPVPDECKIQNTTHNGVFLPYPEPCNCCNYCLTNLEKGAACAKGDPTSPQPTAICGALLSCQLSSEGHTSCDRLSTSCVQEQDSYDKARELGTLGHLQLRPTCDRNGLYAPFACIPGEICYCLSEDGRRLFGEIPYTTQAKYLLKCKCSRSYDYALQKGQGPLHPTDFLRCLSQGDYDTIQCIGQACLCTDFEDGHPTYPDLDLVNITDISKTSLPCFNTKNHKTGSYYRNCELEYIKQFDVVKKYKEDGFDVFGYALPNCQLDGYYAPVQNKGNVKYCAAPSGDKLENFEVPKSDLLAISMNCKCARARTLIASEEKPVCCKNGNYKQMQCRRGLCRCVNEDGMQIVKEVEYTDRKNLQCFNQQCD